MSTLVFALRIFSLLLFAAPMLIARGARKAGLGSRAPGSATSRLPVAANFSASGLHLLALFLFAGNSAGRVALLLAVAGTLAAAAGAALIVWSRAALGAAWSLAPRADHETGLVTSGPYRLVRHPIYLGLSLVALGQAVAFGSWPALVVVVAGIVPTFALRARAEEKLLGHIFGERYDEYRRRTWRILPSLL